MFLRKTAIEPLLVTMSAVRLGDRLLQIGVDDVTIATTLASKVGLSGYAAIAVFDEANATRVQAAAVKAGILADVKVSPAASLPFESEAFDLVIVHSSRGLIGSLDVAGRDAAMREWHRVVRAGGRVMTIEPGATTGLKGLLQRQPVDTGYESAGGTVRGLQSCGFKAVRMLADREGFKFTEGTKQ